MRSSGTRPARRTPDPVGEAIGQKGDYPEKRAEGPRHSEDPLGNRLAAIF
jgi:hypothetical protein